MFICEICNRSSNWHRNIGSGIEQAIVMASSKFRDFMAPVRPPERDAGHEAHFQDVEPEVLATDAATKDDDIEALPEFVQRAIVEQRAEELKNALVKNGARLNDTTERESSAAASPPEIEIIVDGDGQTENISEKQRQSVPPAETVQEAKGKDIKALLKRVARIY